MHWENKMFICENCNEAATHVLVDYNHNVIQPVIVYCRNHAFVDNREECPCCDDMPIEVEDENTGAYIELLPTYPLGTLDYEGCCCQHP